MAGDKAATLPQLKKALLRAKDYFSGKVEAAATTAKASGVTFADGQTLEQKNFAELTPEQYAELEKMLS